MSFRDDDVYIQHVNWAELGRLDVKAIPCLKQILKVFVCGLSAHNGFILKSV